MHWTAYFSGTKGPRELQFFAVDREHASHGAIEGHFLKGQIETDLEVKEGTPIYLTLYACFWKFLEILYICAYVYSYTYIHVDGNV